MDIHLKKLSTIWICCIATACSGENDNTLFKDDSSTTVQSPGGIWIGVTDNNESATFYIAENGEFKSITRVPTVSDGPTFGSGAVDVFDGDQFIGIYQAKGIMPSLDAPRPVELACELSGNVMEREQLSITTSCSDSEKEVWTDSMLLRPYKRCTPATSATPGGTPSVIDPGLVAAVPLDSGSVQIFGAGSICTNPDGIYDKDSSLERIAGNYTIDFRPETNMLTIHADDVIFGNYHNGPNCTVSGLASLIDPNHNLYKFDWTFSNCIAPFPRYEGAEFSGLGYIEDDIDGELGGFYLIMTGFVDDKFDSISISFDRV